MKNKRSAARSQGGHRSAGPVKLVPVSLPRWRWWIYSMIAVLLWGVIFVRIGGTLPVPITSLGAWRESGALADVAIGAVFAGLIVALIKLLLDQVFLGIALRKSEREIAQDLGVFVAQVAVGVAAEGLLTAAANASSSGDAATGGIASGGGGDFGGGGASGNY